MADWMWALLFWSVILTPYVVFRIREDRKNRAYLRDLAARANEGDRQMREWVARTKNCPTCGGCGRIEVHPPAAGQEVRA